MPEFCLLEDTGEIWTVTLNRPERHNAVHPPSNYELEAIFDRFERDTTARVAILTGAGERAFCSGNDLKYVAEGHARDVPKTGFAGLTHRFARTKPVIAAVNGLAVGGGFEIALACDLIVAAESAYFGLPEAKVGLAASVGGLHRLPRLVGLKHALGIILTGRNVPAEEALRFGIVNELVPDGETVTAARRWAQQIIACAPLSIGTCMDVVTRGLAMPDIESAMTAEYDSAVKLRASEDYAEGPRAFAEKRRPVWKGR